MPEGATTPTKGAETKSVGTNPRRDSFAVQIFAALIARNGTGVRHDTAVRMADELIRELDK